MVKTKLKTGKPRTKVDPDPTPEENHKKTSGTSTPTPDVEQQEGQGDSEGLSPLTTLPDATTITEHAGAQPTCPTNNRNEHVDPKTTCPTNQDTFHDGARVSALLTTLDKLADDTHLRYDALDGELQLALAWQERLVQQQDEVTQRIDTIREKARANRLLFAEGLEATREVVASDLPGDVPARNPNRARAGNIVPRIVYSPPDDDVVTYAAVEETVEDPRFRLFRARSPAENSVDYERRLNEQTFLLAREHYAEGTRKHDAKAEKLWNQMETRDGGPGKGDEHGAYPRQYRRHRDTGPPDDGDDDDGDSPRRVPSRSPDRGGRPNRPPTSRSPAPAASNNTGRPPHDGPPGGRGGPPDGPPSSHRSDEDDDRSSTTDRSPRPSRPRVHRDNPRADTRGRSPSYLPEGRDSDYFLSPDVDDPNSPYIDRQLESIRAVIRERVAHDLPEAPGMKNIKNVPAPEKYGGDSDSDAFMTWLRAFLRWLALGRITGPALDADRVQLLGQYLVKDVRYWYDDAIDNLEGVGRYWTFEQAICALYRRFIHKSTARSAADRFQRVKYRRETGVSGLWDSMTSLARKMPNLPDDYTFKIRFIDALPEDICAPMLRNRNISVERSQAWDIRKAALQQEENNRVYDDWKTARRPVGDRGPEAPYVVAQYCYEPFNRRDRFA